MSNPEIDGKIEEGISFYNQNSVPKAILVLREALKNSEGSDLAEKGHYYLASAYLQNDNIEEAADELIHCGSYAPLKTFELIKNIAVKAGVDYKKIMNELPQKDLYIAVIEQEENMRREAEAKDFAEREKKMAEEKLKLEIEGDYRDLFVETMRAAPTNYIFPLFMGIISIPAWGAGMLLARRFPKAIIRFALQYVFYYMYINAGPINHWCVNNINLSQMFGYSPFVNNLNSYIFPAFQIIYISAAVIISLQSFVYSYFEWYKMFLVGNIVEVRNTNDVYINIGFEHHVNIGDIFNVYTRGKTPVLKGYASILKHEDALSLVEFRPDTNLSEIMHPKVGDFVNYKW